MAKVKLHRCPFVFLKVDGHGCWRVQQALEEQGIDHEVVKVPTVPRSRRKRVAEITGQTMVPVIEFEDGTGYRAESKDMVARIRAGQLLS